MRILLTNNTLADRSGSELYVRDLAIALRRRGHEPIAYSPLLGDVAGDLRDATIPVTSDIRSIRARPDVIHGQHHLETMTALARFPDVPAVYVCHGWLPWQENPPRHPRIALYVAVDATVLDRLVLESGIELASTRLLLNFVDLARFRQRAPLPVKPRRALVFNSHASEENFGVVVREACAKSGIELELIGHGVERSVRRPETLLAGYDLVFARGRSALEALATGCAVVVADPSGMAGLVTSSNLDALRRGNFGIRTLTTPLTVAAFEHAIAAYDALDAARVCERVRRDADMETIVSAYEEIYAAVMQSSIAADPDAERDAFVDYLRWLSLQTKLPGFSEWNKLKARCDDAVLDAARLRARLRARTEPRAGVETHAVTLERELQHAKTDAEEVERRFRADIAALRRRFDRLYGVRFFARVSRWLRRR